MAGLIGKMVWGTLGLVIGGPLGAILGAALGHAYDNKDKITVKGSLSSSYNPDVTFFVATFSMLAKIAKVDGKVTEDEIDSIRGFMTNDLSLNEESKKIAVNIFRTALESSETFEAFAVQFYSQFKNQQGLLDMMIDILVRVSVADGDMSPKEEELVLTAVRIFNFDYNRYKTIMAKYDIRHTEKSYAILGCDKNDSFDKIKTQYRKLASEYHPDKILSKGLPEDFIKFANDKFREIKEAYENIKKERNK